MKRKRSILCLLALILTGAYLIYSLMVHMGTAAEVSSTMQSANSAESAGAKLGAALAFHILAPHYIMTGLGFLFNLFAYIMAHRGFTLVSAILYAVAMVVFPLYFMFLLIQTIFMFIAYARMKPLPAMGYHSSDYDRRGM